VSTAERVRHDLEDGHVHCPALQAPQKKPESSRRIWKAAPVTRKKVMLASSVSPHPARGIYPPNDARTAHASATAGHSTKSARNFAPRLAQEDQRTGPGSMLTPTPRARFSAFSGRARASVRGVSSGVSLVCISVRSHARCCE
jgi:hypothetical protein